MDAFPDSPEGVALALFCVLFKLTQNDPRNVPITRWALDLFDQCLSTVRGDHGTHDIEHIWPRLH